MVSAPTENVAQSTAAGGSRAAKVEDGSPSLSFASLTISDDEAVDTEPETAPANAATPQPTAGFE